MTEGNIPKDVRRFIAQYTDSAGKLAALLLLRSSSHEFWDASRVASRLHVGGNHTYELSQLGKYYRNYRRLMSHWRRVLPILDVQYEDIVADVEGQARRMMAYCGLDWDARCLDFHKATRPILTASAAHVRQPIYAKSVARGRWYESFLAPLIKELQG